MGNLAASLPARVIVLVVATFLLWPAAGGAQTSAPSIAGTVTDSTGASLPGVTVTATDGTATAVATAVTDEAGRYTIASLRAGAYTVNAQLPGFNPGLIESVTVEPSRTARGDFVLALAPLSQTVEVVGPTLGTRLNTSLRDTAAPISVLSREFLADIGATDLTRALEYAVNVELELDDDRPATNGNLQVSEYQQYRVRGMKASVSRNYFAWNGPTDSFNVERVEDSRGPNAVLFGIGAPGGVINSATKQAKMDRSFREGSFSLRSFESARTGLDLNQTFLQRKLAVRFNAVYDQTNTFRHYEFSESKRAHAAATYTMSTRSRVRSEFERGRVDDNSPRTYNLIDSVLLWDSHGRPTLSAPVVNAALGINRTSTTQPRVTYIANTGQLLSMRGQMITTSNPNSADDLITDRRIADFSINVGGPSQDRFSQFNTFAAYFEHQLAKTTFVEVAFNHRDSNFDRPDPAGQNNQLLGDPNQFLPNGSPNPFAGALMLETSWIRRVRQDRANTGRVTLSTEVDAGKWGNFRIAGLGELNKGFVAGQVYNESWEGAPFNAIPENSLNFVQRRSYVTEGDWATYYVHGPKDAGLINGLLDPVTGRTLSSAWIIRASSSPNETFFTQHAAMAAVQARYFGGRLIAGVGIRRDEILERALGRMRDPATQIWTIARNDADAAPNALPRRVSNVGWNRTLGIVYHITPAFSVFYNHADNIELPGRGETTMPADGVPGNPIPVPTPQGTGHDVGAGLSLANGRLYTRATYYSTKGAYQSTTFSAPTRNANGRIMDALQAQGVISLQEHTIRTSVGGQGVFDHESQGVELQVTGTVRKNLRLQTNYALAAANETNKFREWWAWEEQNRAYIAALDASTPIDVLSIRTSQRTIAEELDFIVNGENALGEQTEADGKGKLGNRRHKVSLFARYDITAGWLNRVYLGGGYRYQSKMFVGLDDTVGKLYGNDFSRTDLLVGYRMPKMGRTRNLSIQLNVDNLLNDRKPLVTRYTSRLGIRSEVVQSPRTWRVTTNVGF